MGALQSFWMLAGAFSFSLCALCIKLGASDFSGYEMVFYRSVVTLVAMSAVMFARGIAFSTKHPAGHFLRAFSGYVSMVLWTLSIPLLTLGTSQTLNASTPLFIAAAVILIALVCRQSVSFKLVFGVVLGFAGVCGMLRPDFTQGEMTGVVFGLTGAMVAGIAFWSIKELAAQHEPSERIVFYLALWCIVFSILCVYLLDDGFSAVTIQNVPYIAGIGIFATAGQFFTTLAYGKGHFLLTSVLSYSSIVFSWAIGIVVFNDPCEILSIIGMICVIAAGLVSSFAARRGH